MDRVPGYEPGGREFDKIAGRPLPHIHVLRGTCTSVCKAILDARRGEIQGCISQSLQAKPECKEDWKSGLEGRRIGIKIKRL